jgi:FtsZ-binding cell division protein ZapB
LTAEIAELKEKNDLLQKDNSDCAGLEERVAELVPKSAKTLILIRAYIHVSPSKIT